MKDYIPDYYIYANIEGWKVIDLVHNISDIIRVCDDLIYSNIKEFKVVNRKDFDDTLVSSRTYEIFKACYLETLKEFGSGENEKVHKM